MLDIFIRAKQDIQLNTGADCKYSLVEGRSEWVTFKNQAEFDNFVNMGILEESYQQKEEFVLPAVIPGDSDIPVVGSHDTIESIQEKLALKPEDLSSGLDTLLEVSESDADASEVEEKVSKVPEKPKTKEIPEKGVKKDKTPVKVTKKPDPKSKPKK